MSKIGIVGLGFVGNAIYETLKSKVNNKNNIIIYDKYKFTRRKCKTTKGHN